MLERIRQDHATLLLLAAHVRLLLAAEGAIDLGALASVRWHLARVLGSHLAYLGAFVFVPLIKAATGNMRQDLQQLADRTSALTANYQHHRRTFAAATIEVDGGRYREQTRALLDELEQLISDQGRILYPAISELFVADGKYADQFELCTADGW